jgi:aspartate/methionine/tyrosine aminotransferase
MPPSSASTPVPIAARVGRFSYAIRNIATAAQAAEARGVRVRYLNIGDPVARGFRTPEHLVETVARAMRDGHNGYLPSQGILSAREAVANDYAARGVSVSADRVLITTGTSEGIDLALSALVDEGEQVLIPLPTYPLYTAVLAKLGAEPLYYRTDPLSGWMPDIEHLRRQITPRTRVLVVIDPNNPTGAVYPAHVRCALIDLAETHGLTILADEVYGDLAFDGPAPLLGSLNSKAPIISLSSLSKAYLAPGWRTGWLVVSPTPQMNPVLAAIRKLADGRLCSPGPMQYAVSAALTGDRSHQVTFRRALAERGELTARTFSSVPGMSCVAPRAAFYAFPRVSLPPGHTDEQFVLGLLNETGVLVVHGSGFGAAPEDGYFRVVFLADPSELTSVYADVASFTQEYLRTAS